MSYPLYASYFLGYKIHEPNLDSVNAEGQQQINREIRRYRLLNIMGIIPVIAGIARIHLMLKEKDNMYFSYVFYKAHLFRGVSEIMGFGVLWCIADIIFTCVKACVGDILVWTE